MAYNVQVVPTSGEAQELLARIQRMHLSYLQLDENNHKLRTRKELEDLIVDHLSTVPHKEKFPCPKFLEILRRAIEDMPNFSGRAAVRVFDALEKYAVNLISQPWRPEYKRIRLYSGFYKHNVDCHLSSAKDVLFLMGYEQADKMEMRLAGPVDPDKVIDVSLNCLIAAVECQIMMQIMEKTGGGYAWREIAYVRRHSIGGIPKTFQHLPKMDKKAIKLSGMTTLDKPKSGIVDTRSRGLHKNNGYVKMEKLVDIPYDTQLMDADERYPLAAYGSSWEKKPVASNGHSKIGAGGAALHPQTMEEHIAATFNLMNTAKSSRYGQLPLDETRENCWGFVDQSLERKGYCKDHSERGDVLKSALTMPPKEPLYIGRGYTNGRRKPTSEDELFVEDSRLSTKATPMLSTVAQRRPKTVLNDVAYDHHPFTTQTSKETDNWRLRNSSHAGSSLQGMASHHPKQITENLINLESVSPPYLFNPLFFPSLTPVIAPGHVHRANVPTYSAVPHMYDMCFPPLSNNGCNPLDSQPGLSKSLSLRPSTYGHVPSIADTLQTLKAVDHAKEWESDFANSKRCHSKEKHRTSCYDNVGPLDISSFADQPDTLLMPERMTAHMTEPIVPPPTPFRSDPMPLTLANSYRAPVPSATSSLVSSHRRRASDGVADIVLNGSVGASASNPPSSARKLSASSTSGKRQDPAAGAAAEPVLTPSVQQQRSLTTSTRHERSPSAGSIHNSSSSSYSSGTSWSCWACTYLNRPERDVCEMCSRSKHKGAESDPLTSGGHECQKCTLVNEKGAQECIACGQNLKNSPTYV